MEFIRPAALKPGDRVATVSLSWGGPGEVPARYEAGKRQLQQEFDLTVVEMPHTLRDAAWIARNPEARAADLMSAFKDDSIQGVIATIGGDDSIRLLPFLDLKTLRANPKVFVGYSDTTVTHLALLKAGLVSFYGPSVMSGFAENAGMHRYLADSFRDAVFRADASRVLLPNTSGWTVEHLEWGVPENQARARQLTPATGWNWIQGQGVVEGHLIGGCIEVLDWLRGTSVWPDNSVWQDAILFIESSEEAPPPAAVGRMVRSLGALGVLERISALLVGRPGGQLNPSLFAEYDRAIQQVVSGEYSRPTLPIVSHMDFGHTDPFMTLPLGVKARVDCNQQKISLIEPAVVLAG